MLPTKRVLLVSTLITGFAAPLAAAAAEEKAVTDDKSAVEQAERKTEKKKVRPHQHQADAKQGAVASDAQPGTEVKKPLHDHQKFHK